MTSAPDPAPPPGDDSDDRDTFLSHPQFHRTFTVNPTPENGFTTPFTVKYADFGDTSSSNVLLFFGPLMGSRFIQTPKHALALRQHIRIIDVDRPGMGGSDPAPAGERLRIWRVVIPSLLAHLSIPYVSVAAHSGGTIYALDFAVSHPELLFPPVGGDGSGKGGYLALGCPWILPSHTGSALLGFVGMLPKGLISRTDSLARLIATRVGPAIGVSSGLVMKMIPTSLFKSAPAGTEGGEEEVDEDWEFENGIWGRVIDKMYEGGVEGISEDALLFMKKGDAESGWGEWGDYDRLVPRLVEGLRASGRKLRVDVFYAEKDHMIGDAGSKGAVWFDGCWEPEGGEYGDVLEYRKKTIKGADHDSIWSMRWNVAREVLGRVGENGQEAASNLSE
ncbi:hypothetical protein B0T16DRAFT_456048 [Cercophora newfieldiana]|uniref:AB hydrolase-1 domain-containing protein n=1 Tax=Cercophora newfieldiana TaxID=92897 RepID=A0AA39YBM1_9PEZI|nr:hypothetical protein B0T16DRAFT_456048 [Cercophora newfieldiana]